MSIQYFQWNTIHGNSSSSADIPPKILSVGSLIQTSHAVLRYFGIIISLMFFLCCYFDNCNQTSFCSRFSEQIINLLITWEMSTRCYNRHIFIDISVFSPFSLAKSLAVLPFLFLILRSTLLFSRSVSTTFSWSEEDGIPFSVTINWIVGQLYFTIFCG